MKRLIVIISGLLLCSCNQVSGMSNNLIKSEESNLSQTGENANKDSILLNPGDVIWSDKPASEWAEGYPIGNGRIGGMVLGHAKNERIALNHDLLWRQYYTYQMKNISVDYERIREHCIKGEWNEADSLVLTKVMSTGRSIYVNPYVPVGDLHIDMKHSDQQVQDYSRILNMDNGIVEVNYNVGGTKFSRESFCLWDKDVMVTRLSSDRPGTLTGEVSLSRLTDPDCIVAGYSELDRIIVEGEFEEGRKFAYVAKILHRGGRLTGGKKIYQQSKLKTPEKDFGFVTVIRKKESEEKNDFASTYFDSVDEVIILLSITVDDEVKDGSDLVEKCFEKIDNVKNNYNELKEDHIDSHQELYRRVSLNLNTEQKNISTDSLLHLSVKNKTVLPGLLENIFNLSRYLAICSGRPQPEGRVAKAPINLQGIWNQDRRPAWDCDYHLDLNLQMCYWPLDMINLGELMNPLMDWVEKMIPQGRIAAKDLYGCEGIYFTPTCDYNNLGNFDQLGYYWTGAAAWIAQLLWQHWEYDGDLAFLKERLYPFLFEIGEFYEDFLIINQEGYFIPPLSASPEMSIAGRETSSFCSSPSTIDLELIRDIFTYLIQSGEILKIEDERIERWKGIIDNLAHPKIGADGSLSEWMEEHTSADPGHRHRSNLVGLCPGDRISVEYTPDYAEAAYNAVKKRLSYKHPYSCSFRNVWDTQIFARLYKPKEAYGSLCEMLPVHFLDNLLITLNDESGKGGLPWYEGVKLFQIEANIGLAASIIEMIFQDRQHLLRFLPALPSELPNGEVKGLRARGGFEVDLVWEEGKLVSSRIISLTGNRCRFKDNGYDKIRIISDGEEVKYSHHKDKNVISFDTQNGKEYLLTF